MLRFSRAAALAAAVMLRFKLPLEEGEGADAGFGGEGAAAVCCVEGEDSAACVAGGLTTALLLPGGGVLTTTAAAAALLLFLSFNNGNPHPHFSHFLSICCSHIFLHSKSSSASSFQLLLTCAARPSVIASVYPSTFSETSRGKRLKGSIRIASASSEERSESCEKQHIVRMPCKIRARRACEEEEKIDQTEFTARWSASGSDSMLWRREKSACVSTKVKG